MLLYAQPVPAGKRGGWSRISAMRLGGRPDPERVAAVQLHQRRGDVVGHARGVIEQLAQRDAIAVGQHAREAALDGVVEAEAALADELERHDGGERLGDAADAHGVAGAQRAAGAHVGNAGGGGAPAGEGDGAGRAGGDDAVERWSRVPGRPAAPAVAGRSRRAAAVAAAAREERRVDMAHDRGARRSRASSAGGRNFVWRPRSETRFVPAGDDARRADGRSSGAMHDGDALGWRATAASLAPALVAIGAELALLLDDGSASAAAISLTVVSGGALALRRSAPIVVLAVTLAAAIGIVAVGETPAGLIPLIALYTAASACERRTSLAALVPTAAVLVGLSVANGATEDRSASSVAVNAIAAGVLAAGVWGLGAYAQARRERAAGLAREREQRARMAVQHERTAIARELHDIVAHSVSVMLIGVRGARDGAARQPGRRRRRARACRDDRGPEPGGAAAAARADADAGRRRRAAPAAVARRPRRADRGVPRRRPSGAVGGHGRAAAAARRRRALGLPDRPGGAHERPQARAADPRRRSRSPSTARASSSRSPTTARRATTERGPATGIVGMQERVALLGGELETGRARAAASASGRGCRWEPAHDASGIADRRRPRPRAHRVPPVPADAGRTSRSSARRATARRRSRARASCGPTSC